MTGILSLPRVPLVAGPTPLMLAPRLSEDVGCEVWFKRDDLTGVGLGGNKVRALELLLGEALAVGCDSLVTGAGSQSNWAMLAALCARRVGLEPHLVFYGHERPAAGNHQLAVLAGAHVQFTDDPDRDSVDAAIGETAGRLRSIGRRPYVLPRGGATALGAVGYARASLELTEQLLQSQVEPAQLWLATGSCGTQAGLVAGARWLGLPYDVVGVSVSRPVTECVDRVYGLASAVADLIGTPRAARSAVLVRTSADDPGYGIRSAAGDAAAELVARTESIFLDPVFAAKAMAELHAAVAAEPPPGPVVFLVSGGAPTLFSVPPPHGPPR